MEYLNKHKLLSQIISLLLDENTEDYFPSKKEEGIKELTGRQKAAIFLISIGEEASDNIIKLLRDFELETISFEIARIDVVSPKNKKQVLEDFEGYIDIMENLSVGGIDYSRKMLEHSFGSQKAIDIINRLTSSLQVRPFDFIRRTHPATLLNFIQQEHPQTIAVVLSYLEPNKASVILQNLPHETQSEVSKRIATMDRIEPEVLREIERVIEKKLTVLSSEDYIHAGGIESIVEILNLVDRATEKQIIECLEDEDPELAEEIKMRMFIFEDVVMLDDRAIQKVMREVDSQELAKALINVDTEVQDKIFRNMSKRAAGMLKEDMEYMGPVRLRDIEEAQQKIVSITRHLEDTGEIVIGRAGEDELHVATFPENKGKNLTPPTFSSEELYMFLIALEKREIKAIMKKVLENYDFVHEDFYWALTVCSRTAMNRILCGLSLIKKLKILWQVRKRRKRLEQPETVLNAQQELVKVMKNINDYLSKEIDDDDNEEDESEELDG